MISQIPLYFLCFILGWLPLNWGYHWLEKNIPFALKHSKAIMAYFSPMYGLYLCLEFLRAYAIMLVVHDWMIFDYDLIAGVGLWILAARWAPFIPLNYRSPIWVFLFGFYYYLLPLYSFVFPALLILLYFVGLSIASRYLFLTILFLAIGIYDGANSLYILLYLSFVIFCSWLLFFEKKGMN